MDAACRPRTPTQTSAHDESTGSSSTSTAVCAPATVQTSRKRQRLAEAPKRTPRRAPVIVVSDGEDDAPPADRAPSPKKVTNRLVLSAEERRFVDEAAHFKMDVVHTTTLLYQLKNAIVDCDWLVVEAILAIFLHNDTTPVASTILSHSVVRGFAHLGPGLGTNDEERVMLARCEKFALVMLLRLREH
tara:strand:+ start:2665 stop:3228 length:564 start_codon:yes stop_codon:yes gene_type:complete